MIYYSDDNNTHPVDLYLTYLDRTSVYRNWRLAYLAEFLHPCKTDLLPWIVGPVLWSLDVPNTAQNR